MKLEYIINRILTRNYSSLFLLNIFLDNIKQGMVIYNEESNL